MSKIRSLVKTTLLGGVVVILPVTVIIVVFGWIYVKVTNWIQPLTDIVVATAGLGEFVADLIVITVIVGFCFIVGLAVKTQVGRFVHEKLESKVLKVAPGYDMVKETVLQFLGRKKSPFSQVALVQIFENQTRATAFVTDENPDGSYTVFVPTGPNPTSGQIFHLEAAFVHPVDVRVDDAMRSIIACGAGSSKLIAALKSNGVAS